jgi:signal transduction histidine kinase
MGYYFDSTRLESLAETTHLSINMQRIDDVQMPADFQEAIPSLLEEEAIFVMPINSDSIAGYTLFEDVYGEPCLVLKVDMPRNIYKQGQASISFFLLWLFTAGITSSIVVTLLLEKTVLARLAKLNTNVNSIRSHGDHSERVEVSGKDELADLANEINEMLTTLEHSQNKLQILNEKLGVVGSLTRHDARNKLAVIANNLYLAKQKLTNDSSVPEYLTEAEMAIEQIEKIFDFAKTYEKLGREELNYMKIEKVIKEVSMVLDLDKMELAVECPDLRVLADSLLRQLFYNLVDNSLKHGEKVNQIRIYCKAKANQINLIYEDDGVGVPEAEKAKIFEEGYGKGTGYGLYLIRKICEAYGWTIQETGIPSKGAQFIMAIPKMNENEKENYRCS